MKVSDIGRKENVDKQRGTEEVEVDNLLLSVDQGDFDTPSDENAESMNTRKTYDYIKNKLQQSWKNIRQKICHAYLDNLTPGSMVCFHCNKLCPDICRCLDCGSKMYCQCCIEEMHSKDILHKPEQWNVSS